MYIVHIFAPAMPLISPVQDWETASDVVKPENGTEEDQEGAQEETRSLVKQSTRPRPLPVVNGVITPMP